jgi:hyperosmotically inducible protein
MKKPVYKKITIPAAILSAAIAFPAFAQTGTPHSASNTTNPNAENATNPDAQVPPQALGTATGNNQPAVPAQDNAGSSSASGSSNSLSTALKDTDITAKVKYALHENNATSDSDIHVSTSNGVVTLTGQVAKRHQAVEAEKVAGRTDGVRQVVNQLEVAPKNG